MAAATRRRIVVAMSGGVDSSVSAHLLRCAHPNADIVGLHVRKYKLISLHTHFMRKEYQVVY